MTTTPRRWTALMVAGTFPFLVLSACGDDDDAAVGTPPTTVADVVDTTDDTADTSPDGAGDIDPRYADYCEVARTINEQDQFPTDDQFQELRDTAPDEIRAEVEYIVDRISEAEDQQAVFALFGDPEVMSRMEPIDEFDMENCGIEVGTGGNPEGVSLELDPDATRVDVSATEYDFEFDAPPAGPVSFVMSNDGDEPHFLGIGKLLPGVTVEEAIQASDPSEVTEWTADSAVVGPGEEAVLTVDNLEPGEYGMVCFIPSPDGTPHAYLGMAVGFTVE
jgi:hypothetical protein